MNRGFRGRRVTAALCRSVGYSADMAMPCFGVRRLILV